MCRPAIVSECECDQGRPSAGFQVPQQPALTDLLHQVLDLVGGAAGGGVRDGPGGLLAGAEVGLPQDVHQHREDVGVDHLLSGQAVASATGR